MTLPPRLDAKSRIKVIFPASSLKSGRSMVRAYNDGVSLLEKHFLLEGSRLMEGDVDGFSGTDEARAAEIRDAFESPRVSAMIAGRGGYGCLRLLNLLEYDTIKKNPKLLIGLSDLTILQCALYAKAGVPSLSGPLLVTMDERGLKSLLSTATQGIVGQDIIPDYNHDSIEVLTPGTAEGVLLGGNLFSLVQLIGTGFLPKFDNAILFFEDVDETVNHLDSFLNHLKLAGFLYGVQGIIIGDTDWRESTPMISGKKNDKLFRTRIQSIFRREIPIMAGVCYGHCDDSITIPFGIKARLDTDSRSLTLLQEITSA